MVKAKDNLADKIDEIKAWLINTGESDLIFSFFQSEPIIKVYESGDIKLKINDDEVTIKNVDMIGEFTVIKERTLFYWGKLFNENISKGEDYTNLKKVIAVNILDFDYINLEKFHTKFHLWEDEEKEYMLTDLVEIHFIELSKFNKLEEKNLKEDKLQIGKD